MVVSYSGKYRPINGRSNELRMEVLGSRSSRKAKDRMINSSADSPSRPNRRKSSSRKVTRCVVGVAAETFTSYSWSLILVTAIMENKVGSVGFNSCSIASAALSRGIILVIVTIRIGIASFSRDLTPPENVTVREKGAYSSPAPHTFRVWEGKPGSSLTVEEIQRIADEEQESHDLAKLGVGKPART